MLEAGVEGYDFEACLRDYELSLLLVTYRMITGMHLLDFSNERGTALIDRWLDRLEPLLPRDYRELLPV